MQLFLHIWLKKIAALFLVTLVWCFLVVVDFFLLDFINYKLHYQQLHLQNLCNFWRHWLRAPWRWYGSVETFRSVIFCKIIVYLLVIVQNMKVKYTKQIICHVEIPKLMRMPSSNLKESLKFPGGLKSPDVSKIINSEGVNITRTEFLLYTQNYFINISYFIRCLIIYERKYDQLTS
jgi:hypothetical protein